MSPRQSGLLSLIGFQFHGSHLTMTRLFYSPIFASGLAVILSGCVTTQGPVSDGQPNVFQALGAFNPFDSVGPEFRRLVEASKFEEARSYFRDHYKDYFGKRYAEGKLPVPKELVALGDWRYKAEYRSEVDSSISRLRGIAVIGEPASWLSASTLLRNTTLLASKVQGEELLVVSGAGADSIKTLLAETKRVSNLFANSRSRSFATTFDQIIETGKLSPDYPGRSFALSEYVSSSSFQEQIASAMNNAPSESERSTIAARVSRFMAPNTRQRLIDEFELKKAKERLLADGRIDLNEFAEVTELVKKYGSRSGLEGAVKVGYVDLTATSFRDRNVFDFEISFAKDYGITLEDAKEAILGNNKAINYDYLFVTDLSAAKIYREFKDKRDRTSKTQTGTRQERNPDYVTAMTAYQQALADMQKAKMQSAIEGSKPCYGKGWACALAGGLRGLSEGVSESAVNEKSAALSSTPQTLSKPVYSQYNYQLVDISASKVARVDYYVIDVRMKKVLSSYFEIKNHEKFIVSYNVEENDPDRSSILRNSQKEDDVTAWEKKPITVNLSELFSPKNLVSADSKPFTTVEAFVKPLSSRTYAAAAPIYAKGVDPKTVVKGATLKTVAMRSESAPANRESGTIADERFDSVVIVKNARSIGTGFYVTPDLVLTAYHVVDKANLVEITFYDGTKTYGKVIDHDVRLDLALVKVQTAGKPVKIHSGTIKLGETVEAIGHPKGYEFTITRGVVSAVRTQKSAVIKSNALVEFIQTDTPISPGNSGGPLFLKDAVIGVNDWVRVDKASQNLNFSVSFNEIRNYLNRLEGKVK
jgi:serine protease Do